jgi:hypothetical protein
MAGVVNSSSNEGYPWFDRNFGAPVEPFEWVRGEETVVTPIFVDRSLQPICPDSTTPTTDAEWETEFNKQYTATDDNIPVPTQAQIDGLWTNDETPSPLGDQEPDHSIKPVDAATGEDGSRDAKLYTINADGELEESSFTTKNYADCLAEGTIIPIED